MAIRNKDGSIYKLRGPNPLMQNQDSWDHSKVELINFSQDSEKVTDPQNPAKKFEQQHNVVDIGKKLKLEDIGKLVAPVHPKEPPKQPPSEIERRKIQFLAVVAIEHSTTDSLYGDVSRRIKYSAPTNFTGIILNQADIGIEFWTEFPIQPQSIVFPQNQEQRWWRVTKIESRPSGVVAHGIPSDVNPDFSPQS